MDDIFCIYVPYSRIYLSGVWLTLEKKMIKIKTRNTSMVKPAEKTLRRSISLTLLDRLFPFPVYTSTVHIYRPSKGTTLDGVALRESLSRTLVHFYPIAGRYRLDENGVMEIDCNDAGVYVLEAETDSNLEDLGDLSPSPEMSVLIPHLDTTRDISSCPLAAVQVYHRY